MIRPEWRWRQMREKYTGSKPQLDAELTPLDYLIVATIPLWIVPLAAFVNLHQWVKSKIGGETA